MKVLVWSPRTQLVQAGHFLPQLVHVLKLRWALNCELE